MMASPPSSCRASRVRPWWSRSAKKPTALKAATASVTATIKSLNSPARKSRPSWRQARCHRDAVGSGNGLSIARRYTPLVARVKPGDGPWREGTVPGFTRATTSTLLLRFELRDFLLEVGVLLAGEEADLVERREVLLGPGEVVHLQIRLAHVLVRAFVLRVDPQGLGIVLEHLVHVGVGALAHRIGVEVVIVGVVGLVGQALPEARLCAKPILPGDCGLGGADHRIVARCSAALAAAAASASASAACCERRGRREQHAQGQDSCASCHRFGLLQV